MTVPFLGLFSASKDTTLSAPSNVSLPKTLIMVGVSSTTFVLSALMSTTGVTVKSTVWLTLSPLGSLAVNVIVSLPFQSAVGVMVATPLTIEIWMLLLPETENSSEESESLNTSFKSIVYVSKSSDNTWSAMAFSTVGASLTRFTTKLSLSLAVGLTPSDTDALIVRSLRLSSSLLTASTPA